MPEENVTTSSTFESFCQQLLEDLKKSAISRFPSKDVADDMAQQALVEAWNFCRHQVGFLNEATIAKVAYTRLSQRVLDEIRNKYQRKRDQSLDESSAELASSQSDPYKITEMAFMVEAGIRAFIKLLPKHRAVIWTSGDDCVFQSENYKPSDFAFAEWHVHPEDIRRHKADPEKVVLWGKVSALTNMAPEIGRSMEALRAKAIREWRQ